MDSDFQFIIVGSGCSAAHCAATLLGKNVKVLMIDFGNDSSLEESIPNKSFLDIRRTDPKQSEYFLGKNYEGISFDKIKPGAQLTPPRQFVTEHASKWNPVDSRSFSAVESLAYGGLARTWGFGCNVMDENELKKMGLPLDIADYQVIADRIGISAGNDEIREISGRGLKGIQGPLRIDSNARSIRIRYHKNKKFFEDKNAVLGQIVAAMLSENFKGRKANSYNDMDFWADPNKSGYRPNYTIDELKKSPNFKYLKGRFATHYIDNNDQVQLHCLEVATGKKEVFTTKKLILAAGALGSARIALRSKKLFDVAIPVLCNPFGYFVTLNLKMIGREQEKYRTSIGQLMLLYDDMMSVFFSYRSLLLHKLVKEFPLGYGLGRRFFQFIQSGLTIVTTNHPDSLSANGEKVCKLVPDDTPTGDKLMIQYNPSKEEKNQHRKKEKNLQGVLSKLGLTVVKKLEMPYGSSIHYGGTFCGNAISCDSEYRVKGTNRVYLADGGCFAYLPAKGITFTLMAQGHYVAKKALQQD
ncbi:MAG: hypothetical protein AB7F43_00685 [Bacteriovoracia bacterium]